MPVRVERANVPLPDLGGNSPRIYACRHYYHSLCTFASLFFNGSMFPPLVRHLERLVR